MKVKVDIIHGDKQKNEFMHACDMYEPSKQLGEYEQVVVEGSEDMNLEELTTNIKNAYDQSGRSVVFVSVRQVGPTLTNDYDRYIMPNISAITSGKKWGLFKSVLEQIGYEVETNEHMQVESVKLTW